MRQRGVAIGDIDRALRNCGWEGPGDDGGVAHRGPGLNNDPLKVWTLAFTDHWGTLTVKSVAWKGR